MDGQLMNQKLERLQKEKVIITKEKGNSMLPKIKSNQEHKLQACTIDDVEIGDIVYCKVSGRYYTHLVYAKNAEKGCLIGNMSGFKNGWTKQIYGKVIEIL